MVSIRFSYSRLWKKLRLIKKHLRDKIRVSVNDALIRHYFKKRRQISKKILISFRIDDITFSKADKSVLDSALAIARKYDITFDLAVIAEKFDSCRNEEVFKVYSDNRDVFEIVAHGLTHLNSSDGSHKGEFFDLTTSKKISRVVQDEKIKKMRSIFKSYGIIEATEIFVVPHIAGDENTIALSKKYGYSLLVQSYVPFNIIEYLSGRLIVSRSTVSMPSGDFQDDEIIQKFLQIKKLLRFRNIQIAFHPLNFSNTEEIEAILEKIIALRTENPDIYFDFISKRLC